jgi:hypothetical protein
MIHRWFGALVAIGAAAALSFAASAQGRQQPQLRDDEQILPSQIVRPPAVTQSAPAPGEAAPAPKAAAKPPEPARAVGCSGSFAKDSGHLKLAQAFGSQNITFADVEGDEGSTLKASVLFPKDPKRRLEVLWDDDVTRAGTRMIVIAGQSTWTAPKGLHLGLPLAALEKLNGKPFKLLGFGKDGMAAVSDWNGGSFLTWSSDCKLGLRLKADAKAPADARAAVPAEREFLSTDAAIRAVKPVVGEILLAYGD